MTAAAPSVARDYLWPILKGLVITWRHLARSVLRPASRATIEYPEVRRRYSPRYRGVHKLTTREDGSTKCVACMLCATVCPATCIRIEAGAHPDPRIEKFPVSFEIDLLRCVYCGFCVDACPCEAIVMTQENETAVTSREAAVIDKARLIDRPALARFGLGYRPRP